MRTGFEALIQGVLMAPLDSWYMQVGFDLVSVQMCHCLLHFHSFFQVDKLQCLRKQMHSVVCARFGGDKVDNRTAVGLS